MAMGSVRSEKVTDTYSGLYAAAKSVGVTLKITGRKPEEKQLKKIVVTAAIECITNTVKHAKNRGTDGNGLVFENSGDKQRRAAEIDNQRRWRIFFASAVSRA